MDGLAQAFQGFFSNPGDVKLLQTGVAGAGEAGNLIEQKKRLDYSNFIMGLLNNPQRIAAMAAKIQQPLNNGLVQSVNNQVQGDMASRGLAQAPGIFAATEGQALAPFVQQNQNTALQTVMQSLGLPAGSFGQPQNLSPLFGSLFQSTKPLLPAQTAPAPGLTLPPTVVSPSGGTGGSYAGDTGDQG
jgi:hypothetical protein